MSNFFFWKTLSSLFHHFYSAIHNKPLLVSVGLHEDGRGSEIFVAVINKIVEMMQSV